MCPLDILFEHGEKIYGVILVSKNSNWMNLNNCAIIVCLLLTLNESINQSNFTSKCFTTTTVDLEVLYNKKEYKKNNTIINTLKLSFNKCHSSHVSRTNLRSFCWIVSMYHYYTFTHHSQDPSRLCELLLAFSLFLFPLLDAIDVNEKLHNELIFILATHFRSVWRWFCKLPLPFKQILPLAVDRCDVCFHLRTIRLSDNTDLHRCRSSARQMSRALFQLWHMQLLSHHFDSLQPKGQLFSQM